MKRNIVIATIAAATLIAGGTATAIAVSGDDEAPAQQSSVQVKDDDDNDRDDADDAADKDDATDRNDDGTKDDASDGNATDDDRSDNAEDAAEAKAAKVDAADAIRAALKHTSGTAVAAELDTEARNLVWDVDVLTSNDTWHSIQIDPGTGKVLGSHTEQEDAEDTAQARAALKGSSVTAAEAAEAGAAKGTVTSVDLDDEGRTHGWDLDTTGADGVESEWQVALDTAKITADRSADDASDD
jgi:uncharacterized membrane protein YkoI